MEKLSLSPRFLLRRTLQCGIWWALLAMFVAGASAKTETLTIYQDPLTGKVSQFNPKQAKQNVASVASQLQQLLVPSAQLKILKENSKTAKPYLDVIDGVDGNSTLIYRCRYSTARSLTNSMESMISPAGLVEYSTEQNLIIINDKTEKMAELKAALLAIDVHSPQVLVEAKIVEILLSDGMQRNFSFTFNDSDTGIDGIGNKTNLNSSMGMNTSVLGQKPADTGGTMDWYPWVSGSKNMHLAIQWLLDAQDAKILSSPNLVVSRDSTASIVTGQDIPIQTIQVISGSTTTSTDFKRVGVILNVTPKLINPDSVTLKVNPQVSNVAQYKRISQGGTGSDDGISYEVPVISIRNIETDLTLRDGQIIMLGGLYSHTETMQQERVPFFSDIPYIGEFFTSKSRSRELIQLIFFLKVNILSEDEVAAGIIYDPAEQAVTSKNIGKIIKESKEIFPEPESSLEEIKKEFIDKNELIDTTK